MTQQVSNLKEFKKIINQDELVVAEFWTPWCAPCRMISPEVGRLSQQYPYVAFIRINADEAQDISQEVGVRVMPTFMFFKNGKKVGEVVGASPRALQSKLAELA